MTDSFTDGLAFYRTEKRASTRRLRQGSSGSADATKPDPEFVHADIDEIEPHVFQIDKWPAVQNLERQKAWLQQHDVIDPYFRPIEALGEGTATIKGQEYIHFSGYDYLGLARDPRVRKAAALAAEEYGTSASASRIVGGDLQIHKDLEQTISAFLGTEDAIAFISGYGTNLSVVSHLYGPDDLVVCDELAHNSLMTGAHLSSATVVRFKHNDWARLDKMLERRRRKYNKVVILIEGLYSMDGDLPDLAKFVDIKKRYKCQLMVDEAHSLGVLGETGRGISELRGVNPHDIDLWMGTLSKSFGSSGGFIAGSHCLVEYLKYTTPGFVFSVGLSPQDTAAAMESFRILEQEPERVSRLSELSDLFRNLCAEKGLGTGASSSGAVVSVIQGNSEQSLRLSHDLFEQGINVIPILPPGVPETSTRLRFFISSAHTNEQIEKTVDAMALFLNR